MHGEYSFSLMKFLLEPQIQLFWASRIIFKSAGVLCALISFIIADWRSIQIKALNRK